MKRLSPIPRPRKQLSKTIAAMRTLTPMQATYEERRQNLQGMIQEFQFKLNEHRVKAAQDVNNWGLAGDLEHYEEVFEALLGREGSPK
jgi:hypothetical protein